MDPSFDVDAVLAGKAETRTLLLRGLRKRCPRCGGGGIYHGWFRMVERCPTCGYRFEREPGFFVGAFLINFAIAEGFLFVLLMLVIFWKNTHPDSGVILALTIGVGGSIVLPILTYPYSRTIWSAIDLAMTPMEMDEIVAAVDSVRGPETEDTGEPDQTDDRRDDHDDPDRQ